MTTKNTLKLMAATAGAGAMIAAGALTVTSATSQADPVEPGPVPTEQATLGETTVESPAAVEPSPLIATPEITGPAPLPNEEQGLPG